MQLYLGRTDPEDNAALLYGPEGLQGAFGVNVIGHSWNHSREILITAAPIGDYPGAYPFPSPECDGFPCCGERASQPCADKAGLDRRRKRKRGNQQYHQRQAANLRERKRMQSINDAFEGLRSHIPTLPYEKRLSKVDTLKLAIKYIAFLSDLLQGNRSSSYGSEYQSRKIGKGSHLCNMAGHSLSWSSENDFSPNGTHHAKVWIPEDPRTNKKELRAN